MDLLAKSSFKKFLGLLSIFFLLFYGFVFWNQVFKNSFEYFGSEPFIRCDTLNTVVLDWMLFCSFILHILYVLLHFYLNCNVRRVAGLISLSLSPWVHHCSPKDCV